jgi:hypothetical protein
VFAVALSLTAGLDTIGPGRLPLHVPQLASGTSQWGEWIEPQMVVPTEVTAYLAVYQALSSRVQMTGAESTRVRSVISASGSPGDDRAIAPAVGRVLFGGALGKRYEMFASACQFSDSSFDLADTQCD